LNWKMPESLILEAKEAEENIIIADARDSRKEW
jgi:hypothetical protein